VNANLQIGKRGQKKADWGGGGGGPNEEGGPTWEGNPIEGEK